jgi:PPE-repeat protein
VLDFGLLPPEINSARMYSGPGSGPLLAAAAAWDALAEQLTTAAVSCQSVVEEMTAGPWLGPSSAAMAAAAAPYVAWLQSAAAQAEQSATHAQQAAAAYEQAFASTVPPPVIAANRSLLMMLIATNFFGQNTAAIAATETLYAQMWAQDAVSMYTYAETSAAATMLTPFTPPPPTTSSTGPATPASALAHAAGSSAGSQPTTLSQLIFQMPTALQQLAAPAVTAAPSTPALSLPDVLTLALTPPRIVNMAMGSSSAFTSGRGILITNQRIELGAKADSGEVDGAFRYVEGLSHEPSGVLVSTTGGRSYGSISAQLGRASFVGTLSTPPSWAGATPEIRLVGSESPAVSTAAETPADIPPLPRSAFSQSLLGTLSNEGFDVPRYQTKPVMVRSPTARYTGR